jgi:uncharacterized protein YpmS
MDNRTRKTGLFVVLALVIVIAVGAVVALRTKGEKPTHVSGEQAKTRMFAPIPPPGQSGR